MVLQTDPKDVGKTCRFCSTDFSSFNERIRHYYDCKKFYSAFLKMEAKERSKYMILSFLVKNPQYAPLICIGCGTIEKSVEGLRQHQCSCEEAGQIDELNRRSIYGFLPEEGISLNEPIMALSKRQQHIVATLRSYVKKMKNRLEKSKRVPIAQPMPIAIAAPIPKPVTTNDSIIIPIMLSPSTFIVDGYEVNMPMQEVNVFVRITNAN